MLEIFDKIFLHEKIAESKYINILKLAIDEIFTNMKMECMKMFHCYQ